MTYRFGSVGQDTQFCLWDLTDDVLYPRLPLSPRHYEHLRSYDPERKAAESKATTIPPTRRRRCRCLYPRSLSRSNSLPHPAVANTSKTQGATRAALRAVGGGGGGGGITPFSIGRFATLSLQERKSDKSGVGGEKEHKRYHSLGNISKSNDKINVAPRCKPARWR